jgi:hypothetical protein
MHGFLRTFARNSNPRTVNGHGPKRGTALVVAVFGFATTACIGSGNSYPLYPNSGQKLGPDAVASLSGDVAYVDGRDVSSYGNSFELRPGCHVVRAPEKWGGMSYGQPTVWANIGKVSFAMDMQAHYRYLVHVEVVRLSGSDGNNVSVEAHEESLGGAITRRFRPINEDVPFGNCTAALAANRTQ